MFGYKQNQLQKNSKNKFIDQEDNQWPPDIYQATIHQKATKLGELDIDNYQITQIYNGKKNGKNIEICKCCGYLTVQPYQNLKIRTQFNNIQSLGNSAQLFFSSLYWNTILLFLIFCIYGIFTLSANLISRNNLKCHKDNFCQFAFFGLGTRINITYCQIQKQNFYYIDEYDSMIDSVSESDSDDVIEDENDTGNDNDSDDEIEDENDTENIPENNDEVVDNSNCNLNYIAKADKQRDLTFILVQAILGLIIVIFWQLFLLKMRHQYKKIQVTVDQNFVSASDFTVMLSNLPNQTGYTQQDIINSINKWWKQLSLKKKINDPLKIVKVNIAYDIFEYSKIIQEKLQLLKKLRTIKFFKTKYALQHNIKLQQVEPHILPKDITLKQYQQIKKQIAIKNQQIQKMLQGGINNQKQQRIKNGHYAFVTFETRHMLNIFLKYSRRTLFQKYIYDPLRKRCCNKRKNGLVLYTKFQKNKGNFIETRRAPQPQDVTWQNCGVHQSDVIRNKIISFLITLLFLGISFGSIFGLSIGQNNIQQKGDSLTTTFLSFGISIVITIINMVIQIIIQYFSIYQKHITVTKFHQTYAFKSTIAQFINTVVLTIVAGIFIKNVYFAGGTGQDSILLSLIQIVFPSFFAFFADVPYLIKLFNKWRYTKQIKKNQCLLTQKEINKIWQAPQFSISQDYLIITKTILFTAFFCSLQPLIIMMGILTFMFFYWTKKYLLFNRYAKPFPGGSQLNNTIAQLCEWGPLLFALGNLTFIHWIPDNQIQLSVSILNYLSLGIAVFFKIFIPMQTIFQFIYDEQIFNIIDFPYSQSKYMFPSQYDRLNPLTKEKAIKQWIQQLDKMGKTQQAQLQKEYQDNEKNTIQNSLENKNNKIKNVFSLNKNFNKKLSSFYNIINKPQNNIQNNKLDQNKQAINNKNKQIQLQNISLNKQQVNPKVTPNKNPNIKNMSPNYHKYFDPNFQNMSQNNQQYYNQNTQEYFDPNNSNQYLNQNFQKIPPNNQKHYQQYFDPNFKNRFPNNKKNDNKIKDHNVPVRNQLNQTKQLRHFLMNNHRNTNPGITGIFK